MTKHPTKYIKGTGFPYGLVNSGKTIMLPKDYSKDFYFVSDRWTTTRYPKTVKGLLSAKQHVRYNKKITDEIKSERGNG